VSITIAHRVLFKNAVLSVFDIFSLKWSSLRGRETKDIGFCRSHSLNSFGEMYIFKYPSSLIQMSSLLNNAFWENQRYRTKWVEEACLIWWPYNISSFHPRTQQFVVYG